MSLGTGMMDLQCFRCNVDLEPDLKCNICGKEYSGQLDPAKTSITTGNPVGASQSIVTTSSESSMAFNKRLNSSLSSSEFSGPRANFKRLKSSATLGEISLD
jgi:hypothetical protein